jgi:hypothetical protein
MSLVRIVALTISDEVVRWASPGCKEWAEGLARETAVIESDWAALGWAIGSTRVLLDRRAAPLRSLDEVPAATQKLVDGTMVFGTLILFRPVIDGLWFLRWFFVANSTLGRAGCVIGVLGSVIAVTYLLMEWRRLSLIERRRLKETYKDYIYNDLVACAHFYKEQLKSCHKLWIYFSCFLCWMLGKWMYDHYDYNTHVDMFTWILLSMHFIVILLAMQLWKQNKLRRIEEIDALLAEWECGAEL